MLEIFLIRDNDQDRIERMMVVFLWILKVFIYYFSTRLAILRAPLEPAEEIEATKGCPTSYGWLCSPISSR